MPASDYFQRINLTDSSGGGDTMSDRTGDNVREDFMEAITNIAPTQTPFMSGIGRGKSTDVYTSWQQDSLQEPQSGNAALDGQDLTDDVSAKARRVGNVNQISTKELMVTGRADVVDKAGRSSELSYQLAKAAKALKRDQEAILTGNQTATPDPDGATASLLGGLQACFRQPITTGGRNELATAMMVGGNGTLRANTTTVPTAYVPGTAGALTETLLRQAIENCYTNGGDPDTIMVSPALKTVISTYLFSSSARVAALFSDVGQKRSDGGAAAQGSVDIYISDFGAMKIVPNRFLGYITGTGVDSSVLYILDMSLWSTLYLRSYRTKTIAPTGDAEKRLLLVDYSLCYKEEMGNAAIFDIDPATPMTT